MNFRKKAEAIYKLLIVKCLFYLCIYFVIKAQMGEIQRQGWFVLAGMCAGIAYFIRQPSLAVPIAVVLYIVASNLKQLRQTGFKLLSFIIGFASVCTAVWALYLGKMPLKDLLMSQLNPLNIVFNRIFHTLGLLPEQYRVVDTTGFRILYQPIDYTISNWRHTFFSSVFLIFGTVVYSFSLFKKSKENTSEKHGVSLLVVWFLMIFLLYAFQSVSRGFFTQYFTEALPPICVMTAVLLYRNFKNTGIKSSGLRGH